MIRMYIKRLSHVLCHCDSCMEVPQTTVFYPVTPAHHQPLVTPWPATTTHQPLWYITALLFIEELMH